MASLLASTKNTRPILDGSLRYIRSDGIFSLSEQEISWLIEHDILTIVDLRTPAEVEEKPCCLKDCKSFHYINISVNGGSEPPKSIEMVSLSYLNMVDDSMREIISTIENAKTNVIYFCHAGKDRTGVVSALLLLRHGASHEEIIADYMHSHDNLKEFLEMYCSENPNADIDVIMPRAVYMKQFLRNVRL